MARLRERRLHAVACVTPHFSDFGGVGGGDSWLAILKPASLYLYFRLISASDQPHDIGPSVMFESRQCDDPSSPCSGHRDAFVQLAEHHLCASGRRSR